MTRPVKGAESQFQKGFLSKRPPFIKKLHRILVKYKKANITLPVHV